jgi:hypothetical protein
MGFWVCLDEEASISAPSSDMMVVVGGVSRVCGATRGYVGYAGGWVWGLGCRKHG